MSDEADALSSQTEVERALDEQAAEPGPQEEEQNFEPEPPSPPPQPADNEMAKAETKYVYQVPRNQVPGVAHTPKVVRTQPSLSSKRIVSASMRLQSVRDMPDAGRIKMRVSRTFPAIDSNGNQVHTDNLLTQLPPMSIDELEQTVRQSWGGGTYRVDFYDKESGRSLSNIPAFGSVEIRIPMSECPPLFTRAKPEDGNGNGNGKDKGEVDEDDLAILEANRAERQAQADSRRIAAEHKKQVAEMELERRRLELEAMRRSALQPQKTEDPSIKLLLDAVKSNQESLKEMAAEAARTREATAKAIADVQANSQKMMMDFVSQMLTLAKQPGGDDKIASLIQAMQAQNTASIQALAGIMTAKPDNGSQQALQLVTQQAQAGQQQMVQIGEMMLKMSSKGDAHDRETNKALISSILQMLVNKANDGGGMSGLAEAMKAIGSIKREVREDLEFARGIGGGEEVGEEGGGGGIWSTVAKGLMRVVDYASTNPEVLGVVTKLFGTAHPSQEQILKTAQRLDRGGLALPPPMPMPMQGRQGAVIPPQQGMPMPGQAVLPPPSQLAGMPAPVQQVDPAVAMATELEGEIGETTVGMQPVAAMPQTPQTEQSGSPVSPVSEIDTGTPEGRLKFYVTSAIDEALGDIVDERPVRKWWETASENWNGPFLTAIAAAPDNHARLGLIAQQCEDTVWSKFVNMFTVTAADGPETQQKKAVELKLLHEGLDKLVEAVRARVAGTPKPQPVAAPAPAAPAAPPLTIVQPPQTASPVPPVVVNAISQ